MDGEAALTVLCYPELLVGAVRICFHGELEQFSGGVYE
jgi:hypothetical protein